MKPSDCKPGMHLWSMKGYDDVLEVEVLTPIEPLYQDFIWARFLQPPPGWRSPRYFRACRLYKDRKGAIEAAISELDKSLCEYQYKIAHLEKSYQEKIKTKQKLIELYDKE